MNLVKEIKYTVVIFGLLFLMLSVSFLSAHENYDNLSTCIKEGKFAQFKKIYELSNLTNEQKTELMKLADAIIETEKKNSPKNFFGKPNKFWGDFETAKGKNIRRNIKIINFIMYTCFGAAIPLTFFLGFNPVKKLIDTFSSISSLQDGVVLVGENAAQKAMQLNQNKKFWLIQMAKNVTATGIYVLAGLLYYKISKQGKLILSRYKRYKAATKIKRFLEAV